MRVFLALPSYDQRYWGHTMMSVLNARKPTTIAEVLPYPISGSLLPRVFNEALGISIARGYDVLCLLHADVSAEPGWLSMMLDEMQEHDADVLSAVVAIKDERGLSSTAVRTAEDDYRKLSLRECHALPQTFAAEDIGASMLLLNTGLMLMRTDRPWMKQWNGFRIRSCIQWDTLTIDTVGEDWDMSEQLHALDPQPKLMATTAVQVHHWGSRMWGNGERVLPGL